MSAITGIFNLDAPVDSEACSALVGAMGTGAPAYWRSEGRVAFAAGRKGALRIDAHGRMLVADARIDNAATLGLPIVPAPRLDSNQRAAADADLILAAYARWGERCVEHLVGDFAFALWDPATQSLFCARDPMGVRPFYYHQSDGRFYFASELPSLLSFRGVPADVDHDRVIHFLLNIDCGRERTFYRDVRRLPAAHRLTRTPASSAVRQYWALDADREIRLPNDVEYADAFHELFREAVLSRSTGGDAIAATVSGGLDSSSIACVARGMLDGGAPLHTVSLIFPDLPPEALRIIDERDYIAAVTRDGGVRPHAVRGDRISPLGNAREMVRALGEPFAAPNLYLHWAMYGATADAGCDVLLDGFDGDSVVSHGLARFDELLAAGDWSSYEREVRLFATRRRISPARIVELLGVPQLERLAATDQWAAWWSTAQSLHRSFDYSRRELVLRHGMRASRVGRRLFQPKLTAAERSVRGGRPGNGIVPVATPVPPRAAHIAGLMQPMFQDTLEMAYHTSRLFGVDTCFPFFDRRLIEFCVALPADQKYADGWTRRVMRNAMQDVLPDEIRLRSDKGNLLPAFQRGLHEDDALLLKSVDLEQLAAFVDVAAVERMRSDHLDAGPTSGSTDDAMFLLRCTTLAMWMEEQRIRGAGYDRGAERALPTRPMMDGAAYAAAPAG